MPETVPTNQIHSITILSGPVGAGKTTIARELVAIAENPLAYIEGDIFWSFIAKQPEIPSVPTNFRMVIRAMLSAASHYATNGYDTIVDFSIPPWLLKTALSVAKFRNIPLNYVVVKPSEAVCAERAMSRAEGKIEDYSKYHDLYTSFDEAGRYIIQNDTTNPSSMAREIKEGLKEGKFRVR